MSANEDKRQGYRVLVKLLSYVALLTVGFVFLSSLFSDGEDVSTLRIDLADLAPGKLAIHEWDRRKILILHRTPAMIASLAKQDPLVYDAESARSQQPESMINLHRSLKPEYFVAIASGTDLNCDLEMVLSDNVESGWQGGFQDRCRGSGYDFAGRVLKRQQAKRNLIVPEYHFRSEHTIVIGRG